MAEENEDSEPSMDNILSSIREILSEDEEATEITPETPSAVAQEAVAETETNLETEMVAEMNPSESGAETERAESDNGQLSGSEVAAAAVREQDPNTNSNVDDILELTQHMIARPPPNIGAGETILSTGASTNSTDALQELAKALLSKRDIAIGNKDLTLEGLVREILRPLLREWLDQNLPYLIERLVKKEIDHMVNRAERLDV